MSYSYGSGHYVDQGHYQGIQHGYYPQGYHQYVGYPSHGWGPDQSAITPPHIPTDKKIQGYHSAPPAPSSHYSPEPIEIVICGATGGQGERPVPPSKSPSKQKEYNRVSAHRYSMWKKVEPLENEVRFLTARLEMSGYQFQLMVEKKKHSDEKLQYSEDVISALLGIVNLIENPTDHVKSVKQMAGNVLRRSTGERQMAYDPMYAHPPPQVVPYPHA